MSRKLIVSVFSLILVAGIAIDTVVAIDLQFQPSEKIIGAICQNTDDQKLCHETLKSVKGLDSADTKAYIAEAVKATMDSVIKAFNISDRLTTDPISNDNGVKQSLNICKDQLKSALDSLQQCIDMVQKNNIQHVLNQSADFKNWLGAVSSYEQTCTDSFDDQVDNEKKVKEQLRTESLDHMEKLVNMTLNIVTSLSQILERLTGIKL